MAKRVDWMDFAHLLHKERVAMQTKLPRGVTCSLSLSSHEYSDGGRFSVTLEHKETDCRGYGSGPTPAEALDEATRRLGDNIEKAKKRPRLVESQPKALEG